MAQTRIVTLGEILAEPGLPLDAEYWCGREPGESRAHWEARAAVKAARYKVELAQSRLEAAERHLEMAERQADAEA